MWTVVQYSFKQLHTSIWNLHCLLSTMDFNLFIFAEYNLFKSVCFGLVNLCVVVVRPCVWTLVSVRDDTGSMNDVLAGSGSNESVNAGMETFVRLLCINQTHSLLGNRSAAAALQAPGRQHLSWACLCWKRDGRGGLWDWSSVYEDMHAVKTRVSVDFVTLIKQARW